MWGDGDGGMDVFSPAKRSAIMRSVRTSRTKPEQILRRALHRDGFRFALTDWGLPGKPDLVLPARRAVIFVHGCFWHSHTCKKGRRPSSNAEFWNTKIDKNKRRDRRVAGELRKLGWRVLTVWECQLATINRREKCVARLARKLRS